MNQLKLRPYQEEGRDFLRHIRRGFLTDSPGLGKTVQASEAAEKPVLVVCGRKNLIYQWYDFLTEQYPNDKIVVADGTRKKRDEILDQKADWYIINVHMLHSYALPVGMQTLIVDESHHLRNRSANKSKAAAKYAKNNPNMRVYMLTATPAWKELDDIWMQLHIMYPKIFTSYHDFIRMFFVTDDTPYGKKILAVKKNMRKELDEILSPIKFGRTYKDVDRFLPDIIENIVTVSLSKEMLALYNQIRMKYKLQYEDEEGRKQLLFNPIGMLHSLRQVTFGGGKIDAVAELIEDNKKMSVIGCWYRDHAEALQKAIPNSVFVHGGLDPKDRYQKCMRAQNKGLHIVATIDSITEGINLSKYRQVVMVEEHYPPGSNFQFISRVARDRNDDGSDKEPVLVYYVHVPRSIDKVVHNVAKKRSSNIRELIEEALV